MCIGSEGGEGGPELLGGGSEDPVGQRELQLAVQELKRVRALAVLGLHSRSADDLDGLVSRAVATGHVVVERVDGVVQRHVSVLTIHIVCPASRVVLDPYAEVLNVRGVLLRNLINNGRK